MGNKPVGKRKLHLKVNIWVLAVLREKVNTPKGVFT